MLILIAASMAAADAPDADIADPAKRRTLCDVGRVALRDIPAINSNPGFDAYYDDADPLLTICPALRRSVPAGYPLADEDAHARARVAVPIPGKKVREAFIYSIGIPRMSADWRRATVELGYDCTGLCGGRFMAHYIRTATGWRRDGDIRMTAVS